jgi:hypothetical protein
MTNGNPSDTPESGPKKRRFLSAEKKFQIYLEAQSRLGGAGNPGPYLASRWSMRPAPVPPVCDDFENSRFCGFPNRR